jgi:hypothetical protein
VSGPPASRIAAAAKGLPFPGVAADRPRSATASADPVATRRPVKGMIIFFTIVVLLIGGGAVGYFWALPVYHQMNATLVLPDNLLGFRKITIPADYLKATDLARPLREVGVTQPLVVEYAAGDDPTHTTLVLGGQHRVWTHVGADLKAVFARLALGGGQVSDIDPIPPGPLGGAARCGKIAAASMSGALCGWQDHGTIALLIFTSRTPQEGAVLLRAARPALEHRGG